MKIHRALLTILLVTLFVPPATPQTRPYKPRNGFIPDEKTAVRVAEAVLSPIYGEGQIKSEEPFSAKLKNGVWTVSGTLPEGVEGGVAEIRISRMNGTIISVIHGK